ncbi:polysaccharide biosynthesis tyrosine autokinase [Tropicimonas sp. TH_r6]|uniref:polysaccharide biosynthesis tyrosine autokinase n=1 Tax=Tropicimonas sp. TH_r6 TaxID=3082085 RepID=UPI002953C407|nr:polysaccharide biosynthesis tyrosine autokinase [Tropicimonas sp. TH_r6]MDV7141327.1 polysaccharide biosynthesis tyrosine autokinase [Tropicimonas sp. TH_r6]
MNKSLGDRQALESGKANFGEDMSVRDIDLSYLVGVLWRGKWIIAICSIVAAILTAYFVVNRIEPLYDARSVLALEGREEQVSPIDSVVSGLPLYQEAMQTETEILRSREFGHRLVERLDLMNDPEFGFPEAEGDAPQRKKSFLGSMRQRVSLILRGGEPHVVPDIEQISRETKQREAAVSAVLNAISIENIDYSTVFVIRAVSVSPVKAALLADTLADIYVDDQLQRKLEATDQAVVWLSERASELQLELEASEAAAKSYNASIDLVSVEVLSAMNRQLKDMRDRADETRRSADNEKIRHEALETAIASGDQAQILLAAADSFLDGLAEEGQSGGIDQPAFDRRLEQVRTRSLINAQRLEEQAQALEASEGELAESVARQSEDLVTLQQLEREVEANRLIYESFLVRLREISTQYGIQKADARVISQAVVPSGPFSPNKVRLIAVALFLGIVLGCAIVLIREQTRSGVRTARDLESATGYSVMGQVPLIPIRRRAKLVPYILDRPTSPSAEAIRDLRTSIELSNLDKPPQVILMTSSGPGEGKTTNSISLAYHYAALDRRVLLVEGDIRRRVMDQYFDLTDQPGFVSVLSGKSTLEEAIVSDKRVGFDILPGDSVSVSAADVFASNTFSDFIQDLRNRYDRIIIDTPPVLLFPDARSIAAKSDAVLLSVKWDSTPLNSVQMAISAVTSVGANVTGLILTHVNPKSLRHYGYNYEYGTYGGARSGRRKRS